MTGTVISSGLVIAGNNDDLNDDSPIIGYQNLVTTGNVAALSEATDFPATNLGNPITHELWKGAAVGENLITVTPGTDEDVDYLAIAAHNFGSGLMTVSVEGYVDAVDSFTKFLLHFDGTDASTTITDSAPTPHTWTAVGNAQLDTAEKKFDTASLLLDGSGDEVSAPDSADWALGTSDFTIDGWFNCTATLGTARLIVGQTNAGFAAATTSFCVRREIAGNIRLLLSDGSSLVACAGTTLFSNTLNTGWHHFAAVRTGNILRIFIDGVQEGSDTAFTGTVPNVASSMFVGSRETGTDNWQGWLDEIRLSVGIARWTADFTPPAAAAPYSELVSPRILTTDGPVIFRFTKQRFTNLRLRIGTSLADTPLVPQIGVMYVGELLYVQRRLYVGHTPFPMGRRTQVANLKSISGAFIGRIVLGRTRQSSATFQNLTPAWYRANMDPFVQAAEEIPFFFAWRPGTYPDEAGFAWLTSDPTPDNQRPNGMMQVTLEMEGVA